MLSNDHRIRAGVVIAAVPMMAPADNHNVTRVPDIDRFMTRVSNKDPFAMMAVHAVVDMNIDTLRHGRRGQSEGTGRCKNGKKFLHGSFSWKASPREKFATTPIVPAAMTKGDATV
jgi:hypothetical protein